MWPTHLPAGNKPCKAGSCLSLFGLLWLHIVDQWLVNHAFLSLSSGGCKPYIKVLADLVSSEGPLPGP